MATNALTVRVHAVMASNGYVGQCSIEYPDPTQPIATITFADSEKAVTTTLDMTGKHLPELTALVCAQLTAAWEVGP